MRDSVAPGRAGKGATAPGRDSGAAAPISDLIGVVADARDDGLRKPIKPGIYVPYAISMRMFTQILVSAHGEPLTLLRAVRKEVASIDVDQQVIGSPRDLEQWITGQPEWAGENLPTARMHYPRDSDRAALGEN